MENNYLVRYFAIASGCVQGVGFRYFVQTNATQLSITGQVRNMDDGTVEMQLQGTEDAIAALVHKIKQGNMFIRVKHLEINKMEVSLNERGFIITN